MPIEFRCPQCDRLLRTPDGTQGKDAKCPQCGSIAKIPDVSRPPSPPPSTPQSDFQPPPHASAPRDTGNPYQSPVTDDMSAMLARGEVRRGFEPTRVDLGDVLGTAWRIYKANLWPCVGAGAILVILGYVQNGFSFATRDRDPDLTMSLLIFVLGIVSFWLSLGLMRFMLRIGRGETAEISEVFGAANVLVPAFVVILVWEVLSGIGFCLLVIPFFIIGLMFSMALPLLVDGQAGIVDSFRMSMAATKGNKLTLFALGLIMFFGGLAAILVTCGIGGFFVYPFGMLLYCVTYLMVTGQSTA